MGESDREGRRVVLVTGASSGIGAATAQQFAEEDAAVVLAARSEDALVEVAADIETEDNAILAVPTDVRDPEAVAALVAATTERFGRLDVAVVNAGVGEQRDVPLADLSLDEFEQVTETNVHGAYYTTRAVLPALREHGGSLVFVGSYKGQYPSTSTPIYAASKWWLRGFALSVAGRVGPEGVGVTVVNPTGVRTAFGEELRGTPNTEALDAETTLEPDDVADAIRYAASQDPPVTMPEINLYRRDIFERF